MQIGDRVTTPKGTGTVSRPRQSSTGEIVAYWVVLDRDRDKPNYTGTLFSVDDIKQEGT